MNAPPRMRTIQEAHRHIKENDPGTSLTQTALRRLVLEGVIPSMKIGNKYLLSLDALEGYLLTPSATVQDELVCGIRKIKE
ncbi:helix-turn-helix domain-containing protein [Eubacteriales bacterium OttesenSCG-928-G02]|nr:helix-turn-helix domain-containing protein [Eubacteriales bacterium OttesenSCG-928-G02]